MSVGEFVSDAWHRLQGELFPALAEEVGPLGRMHRRFLAVLAGRHDPAAALRDRTRQGPRARRRGDGAQAGTRGACPAS